MSKSKYRVNTVRFTCLGSERCVVRIEPWGTEILLEEGKALYIECDTFAKGSAEIGYEKDGITVGLLGGDPITITDQDGRNIPI